MSGASALTAYRMLGGETVLRELVRRFHRHMDTMPEAGVIRALHGEDLAGAEHKLFKFLSGWLGGPDLYRAEFGHLRLRLRHPRCPIGMRERDQWLLCMNRALADTVADEALRQRLLQAFARTADPMLNRPG